MNWSRSWENFCDFDRIIPSPSRSASGPWCWVGRSVMFLFDCWLAGSKGEEALAEYKRALEVMSAKKAAPKKAALCENDDEVKFIKSNKSDERRQV
ncbi:hypothetical protein DY000_02040738 [Brassica cretica]|uniref:Uncharacterized protein n=1 Tax=Brassica cretica TaxID=69181 RepID=A0ABQ7B6T6_BRACR|nr:hypothetical protein DY000_02040738 [Brassica cretica]